MKPFFTKTSESALNHKLFIFKGKAGPLVNLYLDCEWFPDQRIFLIGYALEDTYTGSVSLHQSYHRNIHRSDVLDIFTRCTGYVIVYGPDIGMLEKRFRFPFREKYRCLNFLKIIRRLEPDLSSYKLSSVEKYFGIRRSEKKYKDNIFSIYKDWRDPVQKQHVLKYNHEDVRYLVMLKMIVFMKHEPTGAWLSGLLMKPVKMNA